jgi:hypothetical protein
MCVQRVLDGTGHRPEGGLMQHAIHSFAGAQASLEVSDIGLQEFESSPSLRPYRMPNALQIRPRAGGKVVQAHHFLAEFEQLLDQVGPDKPGGTRYQPLPGLPAQALL